MPHINHTYTTNVFFFLQMSPALSQPQPPPTQPRNGNSCTDIPVVLILNAQLKRLLKAGMDSLGNVSKDNVQTGTTIRHWYQYQTMITVSVHHEIISTSQRKTKQPNNLRLDKLHTYMNTLTVDVKE